MASSADTAFKQMAEEVNLTDVRLLGYCGRTIEGPVTDHEPVDHLTNAEEQFLSGTERRRQLYRRRDLKNCLSKVKGWLKSSPTPAADTTEQEADKEGSDKDGES